MSDLPHDPLSAAAQAAFAAAPRPPGARASDKARVRAVLPEIRDKRAAGWTYAEIRAELARTLGYRGTLKTLYTYVCRLSSAEIAPAATALDARAGSAATPILPDSSTNPPAAPAKRSRFIDSFSPESREALQPCPTKKRKHSLVEILNKPV